MKNLLLLIMILVFAAVGFAITPGVGDVVHPTAYWWTGATPLTSAGDHGLGWMQAVEGTLEGTTAFGNQLLFDEISAPSNPAANVGSLYVADATGTTTLFFKDSTGTTTNLLAVGSGNTLDQAYDQGGSGSGRTIDADSGAVAITVSNTDNNVALAIVQNDTTNDPTAMTITNAADATGAISLDIDAQTTGRDIEGTGASWYVTGLGDITANSIAVGTLFENALVAASAGNVALTIDAAGNGTITIGQTSTGNIILVRATSFTAAVSMDGAVTLGDAAGDNITITGNIIADVTLDDGTTDSPALTFTDATNEDCTIVKKDNGDTEVTIPADTDFEIVTGNLAVGNGSPGTVAMDGEDFYVNGDSEFDGTVQFDGTATFAASLNTAGNLVATLTGGATFYQIDGDSTASTTTGGILDINLQTATNNGKGVTVTVQLEDGATQAYAYYGNVDDDTSGAEVIDIYHAVNSTGTNATVRGFVAANTVDDAFVAIVGAAGQALVIDAEATAQTNTTGVIDIGFATATTTATAMHMNVQSDVVGGAGEEVYGLQIQLDDNANSADDVLEAIHIDTDDNATGLQHAIVVKDSAGWDAGLFLEGGYLRVGTGATPDLSLGDGDNAFIEGTLEVDGALRLDGNTDMNGDIVGAGPTTFIEGMVQQVEAVAVTNTLTIEESGKIFNNTGDADGSQHDLPEASTAIGVSYTFVVTAAQALVINPEASDVILIGGGLAAGNKATSSTVGDVITLTCIDGTNWFVQSVYPAAGDWVDGGA